MDIFHVDPSYRFVDTEYAVPFIQIEKPALSALRRRIRSKIWKTIIRGKDRQG